MRGSLRSAAKYRDEAANVVASIRTTPFVVGDPNIRAITNKENQKNWSEVPLLAASLFIEP